MSVALRRVEPQDALAVQLLAADPAIAATSNVPYPYPTDGGERFVRASIASIQNGAEAVFAVIAEAKLVGICSLLAIDRFESVASVGYWIGTPYWSRGYATAAVASVVREARYLGLRRLIAESLTRNVASRRVLERNEFVVAGECPYHGPWPERFGTDRCLRYERNAV